MGGQIATAYISSGYENWKKSAEKRCGFRKHNDLQGHAQAEKAYQTFLQAKAVDTQLSEEKDWEVSRRQETYEVNRNRQILQRIFSVVRFLGRLSLPFRGHDETQQSLNRLSLIHI